MVIDSVDFKLLKMLSKDANTSLFKMGRDVGLSTTGVRRRIKKLEKDGLIKNYSAIIDPRKYGYMITAFIKVNADSRALHEITRSLARRHEVCELYRITGDYDLMIKVRAKDIDSLNKFVEDYILSLDSIKSIRTTVTMDTIKETMLNL